MINPRKWKQPQSPLQQTKSAMDTLEKDIKLYKTSIEAVQTERDENADVHRKENAQLATRIKTLEQKLKDRAKRGGLLNDHHKTHIWLLDADVKKYEFLLTSSMKRMAKLKESLNLCEVAIKSCREDLDDMVENVEAITDIPTQNKKLENALFKALEDEEEQNISNKSTQAGRMEDRKHGSTVGLGLSDKSKHITIKKESKVSIDSIMELDEGLYPKRKLQVIKDDSEDLVVKAPRLADNYDSGLSSV